MTSPEPVSERVARPGEYYGNGIPYLPLGNYPGKIIAIEGTDGVGRSTQIEMLREWLEVQGYGVVETGWTRSERSVSLARSRSAGTSAGRCTTPSIRPSGIPRSRRIKRSPGRRSTTSTKNCCC